MPQFSDASRTQLSTCHPDLQALFFEIIKYVDCKVLEGFRNEEKQTIAHDTGKSREEWPNSHHNSIPSTAVDVSPYPVEWDQINRFYWFAGIVMGTAIQLKKEGRMTHSVRFGGDWNNNLDIRDNKFNDLVHFELIK